MPALSLLLLSEDSGGEATLEQVVRAMLRLVDPLCRLDGAEFEVLPKNAAARKQLSGSNWKSRHGAVDLVRTIASKLSEANGFVAYHIDADVPWPRRSPNVDQFKNLLLKITQLLHGAKDRPRPETVEARARRLCLVVPYFEMESWLYQSTDHAVHLCHKHHGGRDADRFMAWGADRSAIDEVVNTKEQTCLRDAHNLALAKAFQASAWDVFWAGASFTRAVCWLARTEGLRDALARTHSS